MADPGRWPATFTKQLAAVRETRAFAPTDIAVAAAARRRRPLLRDDGRLLLIAADHPARGSLAVRDQPLAMASRDDLLWRLMVALQRPDVDGILATADIVEDLLLLGGLDDRIVIGSMNRGGLSESVFELDDRFTSYDPQAIAAGGLDGGKMLCRIDPDDPATVGTLESCGRAVSELAARGLPAMIEPFWSRRTDGRLRNDLSPEATIRSIHIAQGLGNTSARSWLKLPVVPDMARVMESTTLPTLLLGGDPVGHPDDTYALWEQALTAPNVRGLMVGRALLYPPDGDVAQAVGIAADLVHGRAAR
jgi:hypothetical protein